MSGPNVYQHNVSSETLTDVTGPFTVDTTVNLLGTTEVAGAYVVCDGANKCNVSFGGFGTTGAGQSITWFIEVSVNASTWAALRKIDGKDVVTTAGKANSIGGQLGFKTIGVDPDPDIGQINFPISFPYLRLKVWQDATIDAVNTYAPVFSNSSYWSE